MRISRLIQKLRGAGLATLAVAMVVASGVVAGVAVAAGDDLTQNFVSPPDEAKPRVYWWWLNNLVSRPGITRDLEEFKAKGIGGVLLFNAGGPAGAMPSGPDFMSPAWRELVKHAVREAERLGIEVSLNLCSGWDAGGPWITDETASHHYVQAELTLKGPQKFAGKLPLPPGNAQAYRDVALQAWRQPEGAGTPSVPKPTVTVSSAQKDYPAAKAIDGDPETMWVSDGWKQADAPTPQHPAWLQLEYPEPVTTETLWITPRSPFGPREVEVQTSADGKTFTTVKQQSLQRDGEQVISLPTTHSRIFRVLVTASYAVENCQIAEAGLQQPVRLATQGLLAIKAGRASAFDMGSIRAAVEAPLGPSPFDPKVPAIDPAAIMDLTSRLQPDGTLVWDVPAGAWTIVRTGYTTTGRAVSCSTKGGEGPEMDWLDARAMDHHFKSMAEVLLDDSAPLVGKALKYLHDDSWEVGLPNWTSNFLTEFRKFRGYDARPYLPALAGHTVGSSEMSDRFLYDLRKTIADCLAENHYARFAELAHARGVAIHPEAGGPCCPEVVPMDALKNLGRSDIPMGEFWQSAHWHEGPNQNTNGKQTATAAHIYGKRWVMAEAFTSIGPHWEEGPAALKPTADIAFCEGINRFVHHTATSTRPEDGKPGYEYFAGTHFNPNITWWDQAGAWTTYLSRCQWLLSRGLFVADVCYYNGDWAPNLVEPKHLDPGLGQGYDYDVCNAEVLLTRMSVKDGRIVLPDGMSYRALALPERAFMPVEVLRKVKELVETGATVVGPRPEQDPGLKDYPRCDDDVRKLAGELWGDCDGKTVTERSVGKGRIVWGKPVRAVLTASSVAPDFEYVGQDNDAFLDFIHRRDGDAEIYFVANRLNREEAARCTFRVAGKQPELWDPVSGSMREATAFSPADGRTTVPLDFAPHGSIFVIFRKPLASGRLVTDGSNSMTLTPVVEIAGPWQVQFDPQWFYPAAGLTNPVTFTTLTDWSQRPEAPIKHFSGTATYSCRFEITDFKTPMILSLGTVKETARIRLNGQDLGVVWCAPWRLAITTAAKPGENRLEIEVANLWPNRLIGDAALPEAERRTRTNVPVNSTQPLMTSGLLGPVRIMTVK
ncbi:MAG: glycosyl hydrolase [Verrucomicrobia bacterium]|nr:glycosyl hydrolase [Verrucomicrobiota bacterium]